MSGRWFRPRRVRIAVAHARRYAPQVERREDELRYRLLFEHSMDAVVLTEVGGGILAANAEAQRIFGCGEDELRQLARPDFLDLTDPETVEALALRTIGGRFRGELTLKRRDGSRFAAEVSSQTFTDHHGRQLSTSVIRDISEAKRGEALRREQAELLETVSARAHIGGWSLDPASGVSAWTAEAARIHGLPPDAPIDVALGLTYYVPEHRQIIADAVRDAVELGKPYDLELQITTATGVRKWISTSAVPVVRRGTVVKVWGTLKDISARRQTEDRLRELSQAVEQSPAAIVITDRAANMQ